MRMSGKEFICESVLLVICNTLIFIFFGFIINNLYK